MFQFKSTRMGLCCCLNLQRGVVLIGVVSLLTSAVFVVMNLVTSVTFEEHVTACRTSTERDVLGAFPKCDVLTDASLLMAARIFIYIQLLVWITETLSSVCLIVAAIKKRTNLLIPWITVSVLVVMVLAWSIYQASLQHNLLHLLLLIITFLVTIYFLIVVRSFGVHVSRGSRSSFQSHDDHHVCHRSSSSIQTLPTCFEYSKHSPDLDFPPAYTPFSSSKKGPMPISLGMRY